MRTFFVVLMSLLSCVVCAHAGGSRAELIFEVRSALKTRDYQALVACFAFDDVPPETQRMVWKAIEQMLAWPAPHVTTSERKTPANGKPVGNHSLNGEWIFQIHVHNGPPPSRGFVFPAGRAAGGRMAILLSTAR